VDTLGIIEVLVRIAWLAGAVAFVLGLARMIQGLSLGGEYGTSATYLSEIADPKHRGFYSSFQYVTLIGGQLCAIVVLLVLQRLVLTPAQLRDWGWRIPFVVGALLAVTALYIGILFIYGQPEWRPLVAGYLGLLLLGSCFIAIGLSGAASIVSLTAPFHGYSVS
jgi:MFS family permease